MLLRKILTAISICFLAAIICLPAAGAASPDDVTDARYGLFSDPGYLDFITGNQISALEYVVEDDIGFARIHFVHMGVDPFFFLPISLLGDAVNCNEYKYLAVRVRSEYETHCNLYFGTSLESSLDESKNMPSARGINGTGDWETVVFFFGDSLKWSGLLTSARFDPYGSIPEGMDYLDIAWFAFVKEEADLEKLDVSLDDFNTHETYTRRPVYSTPDRTKPPENTFKAVVTIDASAAEESTSRGFPPAVLIAVTTILSVAVAVSILGIIYMRTRNRQ